MLRRTTGTELTTDDLNDDAHPAFTRYYGSSRVLSKNDEGSLFPPPPPSEKE
jgi:hypothetical protein